MVAKVVTTDDEGPMSKQYLNTFRYKLSKRPALIQKFYKLNLKWAKATAKSEKKKFTHVIMNDGAFGEKQIENGVT